MGEASAVMATISSEDVRWDFEGSLEFECGPALAVLLAKEVVFLNNHWWRKDLSNADKRLTSINVNCSDVFAWACADAESLPFDQIQPLYEMWEKDREWGSAAWCIKQRNQMPQKPVEDAMTKAGWDVRALLDALKEEGEAG